MTAQPGRDEQSDAQYLDSLPDYKACGMEQTPGFREFVLDTMDTIGERPRGGDLCSMHMAYKAGLEHAAPASGWQDEKPTDGKWFLSLHPSKRLKGWLHVEEVIVRAPQVLFDDCSSYSSLDAPTLIGAKWKRRETPQDPFAVST